MIAAVDPGFSGAIALLEPITRQLVIHDMPTLKGVNGKTMTDRRELGRILMPTDPTARNVSMVENVSYMQHDGKDRVWQFGKHMGHLEMVLDGLGYETYSVTPAVWKKFFKLATGSDKSASRALAMARFPRYEDLFRRVKDDGRAEAALIALYALETISGLQNTTAA